MLAFQTESSGRDDLAEKFCRAPASPVREKGIITTKTFVMVANTMPGITEDDESVT